MKGFLTKLARLARFLKFCFAKSAGGLAKKTPNFVVTKFGDIFTSYLKIPITYFPPISP